MNIKQFRKVVALELIDDAIEGRMFSKWTDAFHFLTTVCEDYGISFALRYIPGEGYRMEVDLREYDHGDLGPYKKITYAIHDGFRLLRIAVTGEG